MNQIFFFQIVNNVNLLSLPGKTASRFLLSAARIVLTDEQYKNGYLPDFRGNKTGRVPIPEDAVNKLKGLIILSIKTCMNFVFIFRSGSFEIQLQGRRYAQRLDGDQNKSSSKSNRHSKINEKN